jgi:hypothetical protein
MKNIKERVLTGILIAVFCLLLGLVLAQSFSLGALRKQFDKVQATLLQPCTPATSVVPLQPTVIVSLVSPSQTRVRMKLVSKVINPATENTLNVELFENGVWQPKDITQTTEIYPDVTVVTRGFVVIQKDWFFEFERPIKFEETLEFMRLDDNTSVTFTFVKRSQNGSVELDIVSNVSGQTAAGLCPTCGTSLGMGRKELNGIDAQNLTGIVSVKFYEPWRFIRSLIK